MIDLPKKELCDLLDPTGNLFKSYGFEEKLYKIGFVVVCICLCIVSVVKLWN